MNDANKFAILTIERTVLVLERILAYTPMPDAGRADIARIHDELLIAAYELRK